MILRNRATSLTALFLILVASCAAGTGDASADNSGVGSARSQSNISGTWVVYVWDSHYSTLHQNAAPVPAGAVAGFPLQTNMTALLTTTTQSGLLGNLTGKSLTATVSLSFTGSIVYGLQNPNSCASTPANVRFFISSDSRTYSPSKAGRNETAYWWSNPVNVPLNAPVSGAQITVPLAPGNWSDANGHYSSDPAYSAGFAAAVSNLRQVGVSFGGGCYFDTGIGVSGGSGTFTLNSIAAS